MRAIVNATPLIALAAIGRLHLLQDLFKVSASALGGRPGSAPS